MGNYNSYYIDGEIYVSVSTILGGESAGDLVRWALNKFGLDKQDVLEMMQDSKRLKEFYSCKTDYNKWMRWVSNKGTKIHAVIESDLKEAGDAHELVDEETMPAVQEYLKWKNKHKLKMLESEVQCHSKKWRIAGTCDLVAEIDGELYICDIKTGSVREKAFTQMAAYRAMLSQMPEMKKKLKGIEKAKLAVLSVHRDGNPVQLITFDEFYKGSDMTETDELGIFHALRYIWAMRNIKSRKWSPVIKNMEELIAPMTKKFKDAFLK